jgi:hypothetical protein
VGYFVFFFYTLQSHPAVVLYVYLYAKSAIPTARARNPNILFSALAVEALLLPASGSRSSYSHDFFPGFAQELAIGIKGNEALSSLGVSSNGIGQGQYLGDGKYATETAGKRLEVAVVLLMCTSCRHCRTC